MHDIRSIRENPAAFDVALARRGLSPVAAELVALDERRRGILTELQSLQSRRNEAAKEFGYLKSGGGAADKSRAQSLANTITDALEQLSTPDRMNRLQAEMAELKIRVPDIENIERAVAAELDSALAKLPNSPLLDVPNGRDEQDNEQMSVRGTLPNFTFTPRAHDSFGPALGLDFETGAAMSGARFTLVRGAAARLHRALGQFMLDTLSNEHGYEIVVPPLLVRDEAVFGTGQLPKFAEDLFRTTDGRWLIPTAEVSLTNIVREKILSEGELPLRFTALTPCFRSEAGSAGRDTRGFIRQHQFEKAEMVSIVTPDASEAEHERMTQCAEGILTALGLPFRRMKLCTGDMGFTAARTYDLEVWLPGQGQYREISSCSTCTDFQARRMNTRYRPSNSAASNFLKEGTHSKFMGKGPYPFVHTLNGSGLAVGRTLVAVFENYQQEDGSVAIPEVLQPYLKGLDKLEPAR